MHVCKSRVQVLTYKYSSRETAHEQEHKDMKWDEIDDENIAAPCGYLANKIIIILYQKNHNYIVHKYFNIFTVT